MDKHKLAIIVPYRDRQKQLDVFLPHMKKFLSRKAQRELYAGVAHKKISGKFESFFPLKDYDIFVIEQMDDYPFNRGMLINSCVKLISPEYDYFVFQDIDLLPINDNIHYGYEEHDARQRSHESLERAVELARQAAGDDIIVTGSIAPLEDCYEPDLFPGNEFAQREFRELAIWLQDTGVDIILFETMGSWLK